MCESICAEPIITSPCGNVAIRFWRIVASDISNTTFVVDFLFSRVKVLKREGESKRNMSNGAAENGVDRQVIFPLSFY